MGGAFISLIILLLWQPVFAECTEKELQNLRQEGYTAAEIQEYCEVGDDDSGFFPKNGDGMSPDGEGVGVSGATSCQCSGGIRCSVSPFEPKSRGSECTCRFESGESCRGIATR